MSDDPEEQQDRKREELEAAADSAVTELCNVDASMDERVQAAEWLAQVVGLPWPPVSLDEPEEDEEAP